MTGPLSLALPSLSPAVEAVVRTAYGALLLLTLVSSLPHARRYYLSERWGGYVQPGPWRNVVHGPAAIAVILAAWLLAAGALTLGWHVVIAAALNLALCWYFFIRMRWQSVLRGMGAPGFIAFWLGAAVFLLELTRRAAPAAHDLALWVLQVDFALIMISAGVYKFVAGYRAGDGMDLGMVNPEWGYRPSFWQRWPTGHPLFRFLNEMAWLTEVGAGALMLVPATRAVGALLVFGSFLFIATQIRLGFLCEMILVCCLIFVPGGPGVPSQVAPIWQPALIVLLWTYVIFLPIVRVGMYYNQLAHRRLPGPLQAALDAYTNLFGLIIWRVFSADVVNFFVQVWEQPAEGSRRLLSDYEGFTGTARFRQVAEAIAITSVFTTLKYYPGNRALFVERLMRYARTIPHVPESTLVFQWVSISKREGRFERLPGVDYVVDTANGTVTDVVLNDRVSVNAPSPSSPLHEAVRPGSYAPVRH